MNPPEPRQLRPAPAGSRAAALAHVRWAIATHVPDASARVKLLERGRIGLQLGLASGEVLSLAWLPHEFRMMDRDPLTASTQAVLERLGAALGATAITTAPAGSRQPPPAAAPASRTILILATEEAGIRAGTDHLRHLAGDVDLDLRADVISPERGEKARLAATQALAEGAVAQVAIVMTDVASIPAPERAAWLALVDEARFAGRLALLVGDHTGQLHLLGRPVTEAARVILGFHSFAPSAHQTEDASADGNEDTLLDHMSAFKDGPEPR